MIKLRALTGGRQETLHRAPIRQRCGGAGLRRGFEGSFRTRLFRYWHFRITPSYGLTIRCWATIRDTVGWLMLQRRAISAPDFRPVMKLLAISSRLAASSFLRKRSLRLLAARDRFIDPGHQLRR